MLSVQAARCAHPRKPGLSGCAEQACMKLVSMSAALACYSACGQKEDVRSWRELRPESFRLEAIRCTGCAAPFGIEGWRFSFLSVAVVSASIGGLTYMFGEDPRTQRRQVPLVCIA